MPAGVRRRALVLVLASAAALMLGGVAAGGNGGLLPPPPHSPNAERITDTYIFVLAFTGAIFLIVEGALVVFAVRYRRGRRARTVDGPQIHGATRLEIIWTILPVLVLVAIGGFVFYKLPGIVDPPPASATDETTIVVEGSQFYWLFRYPNGAVSVGTMVAPADTVVRETVVAPITDVNHSWWVPELGPKIDAIPGKTNHTWFKAPVGQYVARCAELCGIQHAKMDAVVRVVPRAEYEAFIATRLTSEVELGKETFDEVCLVCHRLDERLIGPALRGNPLLVDRQALELLLREGRGMMPPVGANWTDEQIDALVAYTRTIPSDDDQG
jgi:cytochrome c oxidase subunit 2